MRRMLQLHRLQPSMTHSRIARTRLRVAVAGTPYESWLACSRMPSSGSKQVCTLSAHCVSDAKLPCKRSCVGVRFVQEAADLSTVKASNPACTENKVPGSSAHSLGKRGAGNLAVLLNTCLHPLLFTLPSGIFSSSSSREDFEKQLHGAGGVVNWMAAVLVELGSSSVRVATMAATHLCSQLLRAPHLVPFYADQVRHLRKWRCVPSSCRKLFSESTAECSAAAKVPAPHQTVLGS